MTPLVAAQVTDGADNEMRVYWDDLNRSDQPGEYELRGLIVVVTLAEIEIWEDHPDASFALFRAEINRPQCFSLWKPLW